MRNSRIVILDEATGKLSFGDLGLQLTRGSTASVDYATEKAIQTSLRDSFADKTVLCVAHRLRTILAYDRICVLDNGQVVEFDSPLNLFARVDGVFRGMCDRSGIEEKDIGEAAE